jgi:phosphatidylglycerophosphate synthase
MRPWLPNAISVLRIALVPVWLGLAFEARHAALSGAKPSPLGPILVLIAIGVSDVIDGTIARLFRLETNLGATLDAIADKLAQISTVTFLALLGPPAFAALPLWLMVSLALRDVLLAVGWLAVRRKRGSVVAEHRWHGKASSVVLFALVLSSLAGAAPSLVLFGSVAALLLLVPSTIAYLLDGSRQLRGDTVEGPAGTSPAVAANTWGYDAKK